MLTILVDHQCYWLTIVIIFMALTLAHYRLRSQSTCAYQFFENNSCKTIFQARFLCTLCNVDGFSIGRLSIKNYRSSLVDEVSKIPKEFGYFQTKPLMLSLKATAIRKVFFSPKVWPKSHFKYHVESDIQSVSIMCEFRKVQGY